MRDGDGVGGVSAGVGGLAVDCQGWFQGGDVDLFVVGAGVDEHGLLGCGLFVGGGDGLGDLDCVC